LEKDKMKLTDKYLKQLIIEVINEEKENGKITIDKNHNIFIDGKLVYKAISVNAKGDKTEINYQKVG
jgi:hypothetical protein